MLPVSQSETRANGTDRGSDNKIVNGCTRLSNWAARIMYMNTTDRAKAMTSSPKVRSSSRARPAMLVS